jgi:hypothetical protein
MKGLLGCTNQALWSSEMVGVLERLGIEIE